VGALWERGPMRKGVGRLLTVSARRRCGQRTRALPPVRGAGILHSHRSTYLSRWRQHNSRLTLSFHRRRRQFVLNGSGHRSGLRPSAHTVPAPKLQSRGLARRPVLDVPRAAGLDLFGRLVLRGVSPTRVGINQHTHTRVSGSGRRTSMAQSLTRRSSGPLRGAQRPLSFFR
jgi:hypothetical protein